MNAELRSLLAEAGYGRALEPGVWSSVIVLKNYGAVPSPPGLPPESSQKGFKLLLLDRRGRATHFAHLGASTDPLLERQTSILETLCADPALARIIPRTRCACSPRLRLQLTTYIPGRSYAAIIRHQNARTWARAVSEILDMSETVTRRAADVLPQLLAGGVDVALADAAEPRLQLLSDAGVPSPYIEVLRTAFRSVAPLPRRIQHGDLWPANVLRHGGSWWLIDFAEFGQAQVPMYDVFLLVHHTWLMRDLRSVTDDWTRASRHVVTVCAERLGLSPKEVGAAMVYYLVHLSSYRLRHGVWHTARAHFVRDLLRTAEALRDGSTLEDLAFPWERRGPEAASRPAPVSPPPE